MFCRTCRYQISAYLDGELTPREAERLHEHLARCPACAALLHQHEQLRQGLAALPAPPVRADAWVRLQAEAARRVSLPSPPREEKAGQREPWWLPLQQRILIPSGALVILFLGLLLARPTLFRSPSSREEAPPYPTVMAPWLGREGEGRKEEGIRGQEAEENLGTVVPSAPQTPASGQPRTPRRVGPGARRPAPGARLMPPAVRPVPMGKSRPLVPSPPAARVGSLRPSGSAPAPLEPVRKVVGRESFPGPDRRKDSPPTPPQGFSDKLLSAWVPANPATFEDSAMVPLAAAESRPSPHAPGAVLSLATTSLPPVPGSPGPSGPSDVDYHFATESKAGRTVRRSVSDAARGITVETEEEEQTTDGLEITRASITITEMQPIPDPETGVLTYVTTRRPVTAVRVAEVPAHVSP